MGQRRNNLEAVTDFANGQHFIRLHRDIVLPKEVCEAVRRHLSAERWQDAESLVTEHAPANAQEEIRLFFSTVAASEGADADATAHA